MLLFKDVGTLVKYVRKKAGMTQVKFSKIIKSGQQDVAKYELGVNIIPGDKLLKVINFGLKRGYFNEKR